MKARKSDLVAMGFLIAAAVLFALFHVLPFRSTNASGYGSELECGFLFWRDIGKVVMRPSDLDVWSGVFVAAFFMGVLLVITAPFLVGPLSKSRLLWWLAMLGSGLVFCGITVLWVWLMMDALTDTRLEAGAFCLLLYPLLHFIGILCIRKRDAPSAFDHLGSGAD